MIKIQNPYIGRDNYNCFGCSPLNESGLQMEFWEDGDDIVCFWEPKKHITGFKNVMHGGIQSTMMDEIASWVVFIKLKTGGVTSKLEVKYKRPVLIDKGKIVLRARVKRMLRNVADIEVELFNSDNKLCSAGNVYYHTFSKEEARKKLAYPEYEKFFEDK